MNLDIKKIWKTKEKYGLDGGHYSDITINIIQKDYQGNTTPTPYGTIEVKEHNGEIKRSLGDCESPYANQTITDKEQRTAGGHQPTGCRHDWKATGYGTGGHQTEANGIDKDERQLLPGLFTHTIDQKTKQRGQQKQTHQME